MARSFTKYKSGSWSGRRERDVPFERYSFDEFRFEACAFDRCQWRTCRFYRVTFHEVTFTDCRFDDCRFWGQHSYLGPARYERCIFRSCAFKDVQPWLAEFVECTFPGTTLTNLTFFGDGDLATKLSDVDWREATLSFVGFEAGVDLSTVQFPQAGVRLFANPGGAFRRALFDASGADDSIADPTRRLTQCPRRALLLLAGGQMHAKRTQDPVVFDDGFLASMLEKAEERDVFERIAARFEIRRT